MTDPTAQPVAGARPDLSGRTALITGASRGIGRTFAKALAEANAHVILLARTIGGLEELDDEIRAGGGSASLIPADITDGQAMSALGPTLSTRFNAIDILVLNAGTLGELTPLRDTDEKQWRQVIETNLTANWRLLAGLDPLIAAARTARIIGLTSRVGGEIARPYWGSYGVSKAGLEMLLQTYALENHSRGTRVAIIDPGATRTRMRASAMPGEDPETVPEPDHLVPLLYTAVSPDFDGAENGEGAARLVARDLLGG